MTDVISNSSATPAIIVNGKDHGRDRHDDHATQHIVLQGSIHDAAGKVLESVHTGSRLNGDAIAAASRDNLKASCDIKDDVCMSTAAITATVERQTIACREAVERNGQLNLSSLERNSAEIRSSIQRTAGETQNLISRTSTDILLSTKENLHEICKAQGSIERQAAENKACLLLEAEKNSRVLERQAADNASAIRLDLCQTENRLTLQAAQNKADLASQIATCCCEVKEKIDTRANQTDLLVRELDVSRVRDALAAAQQDNLILRLGGITPLSK